ncbi:MAG: TIGR03619 family F420-dependent LLM class oxidoreductase [Actinobacteria bacterium]|nr:MAG: TIGR03619 family F420-dependent LLM class oxidoreductase [Actinomycetota bacterium]REK35987.1 MAG: TIGR03619 family F420-dependent LLM class oxidoreductase [Actinomycetota bacterium]
MEFGVLIFPADTAIRPDELAVEVEKRGFDSLWIPEHSHIPSSRETPWGGVEGAPPLPEQYWHSHDQFVSLSYAAAVTDRLLLGTGITLLAQRDPIWTAKEVASLDHLSGGRVLFGVGYGWNKEEMASHGVEYGERRALLREKVLMMKSLWTEDEASFNGDMLSLQPSWAWPKPARDPHPPILMGADVGPRTLADIVEFCDGWIPLGTRHDIEAKVGEVRGAIEQAGRDPDSFSVTAFGVKIDRVDDLKKAGVDRAIFSLPPLGSDVVIPRLDKLASEAGI